MKVVKFLFLSLVCLNLSCSKDRLCNCFYKSGKTERKEIILDEFNEIHINNIFNVYLTQDTINKITIEGGKNLIPNIKATVDNKVLEISDKNKCNFLRNYETRNLYISVKPNILRRIAIYGEINLYSTDTINSDELEIVVFSGIAQTDLILHNNVTRLTIHAATGSYTLRGISPTVYYYSFGTGWIFADKLKSDYISVSNKSTGDAYIYASKEISGNIDYIGNVYYSGNPAVINVIQTSKGRLIKQD